MSITEPVVVASGQEHETATQQPRDAWGNVILDAPGPMGQYRIQSAREWDKGCILRVCGEASSQKHLLWWDYDAGERRMVCSLCFGRKPERQSAAGEQTGQAEQEASDV